MMKVAPHQHIFISHSFVVAVTVYCESTILYIMYGKSTIYCVMCIASLQYTELHSDLETGAVGGIQRDAVLRSLLC